MKSIIKFLFWGLILICIITGGIFIGYKSLIFPVSNDNSLIEVNISDGSSLKSAAKLLEEKNLIKNEKAFLIYAKINSLENIKSGSYSLNKSQNVDEILQILNKGSKPIGIKITIPEGYEIRNIAEKLESAGITDFDSFISATSKVDLYKSQYAYLNLPEITSLEGFLFPDTYYISEDATNEQIIKMFLDRFSEVYEEQQLESKIQESGLTLNEFITLASIVEREAVKKEERPIISGIFYNRLSIQMPLQSCATVQYILKERKPVLSIADTKIDSPYNTYLIKGLPPAPIASPGLDAILATSNPQQTKFLYFVAKGDGGHEFSETYEQHLQAKKKYLGE
ncbi:endolytic transglycosylase MltG [Acetoanaerobium sticklandii]|uniref:endolytic transglycosylase MltG n=1 Tax=Acetoanaerobium sticklandii TaxID=1511 RepID=UPI003A90916B